MTQAGLTQTDLARRCGVSKQAISAILAGTTKAPKAEHVFKIADATGHDPRWIATGRGPQTKQEAARQTLDLSDLSPSQQAAIRAAVHALAESTGHNGDTSDPLAQNHS